VRVNEVVVVEIVKSPAEVDVATFVKPLEVDVEYPARMVDVGTQIAVPDAECPVITLPAVQEEPVNVESAPEDETMARLPVVHGVVVARLESPKTVLETSQLFAL
jgi:hypothetical protein